ncbi:peptidoglycan/LPS O-acetylase OafA/YrhL [Granulicella aggregans]|uniref:Peptidoglycan/LPS O-acetylase OafA/YrhL n=1 Tax=Granulicella aggregans TaxID=474949 RepID=A0A7W7ZC24_9BACT|nr:acyltransferase [Granulicella aggregans]MBB5057160.1 peptidoglycan/LPS O-acetylase OafA/YrhL [Granulicella aggregans]
MSAAPNSSADKIHPLTSLRFFAAFFVVIYHTLGNLVRGRFLPANINTPHPADALPNFGSRFLSIGFVSVSFFFLLSGYILAIVYLRREKPIDRRKFFIARFARVYPLFFITLLMDLPFSFRMLARLSSMHHAMLKIPINFVVETLMLHAWLVKFSGINFPNWSLSAEAVFYLSFPFIGLPLWRLRGKARWTAAVLLFVGGQALVFAWSTSFDLSPLQPIPLLHLSTFALGILLASWQFDARRQSPKPWQAYAALVAAAIVMVAAVETSPWIPLHNLGDGILAPIFMLLIWALSSSATGLSRMLSVRWLVVLGEASFGLYLLHIPVLHIFESVHSIAQPWAYALYLALTIILSVLSFYFVEAPLRRWILASFDRHPRESLEAASIAQ